MSRRWIIILTSLGVVVAVLTALFFAFCYPPVPKTITYGMSFNTPYARELGLDWKQTYDAILDDLKVRHLRLAAHWPMVEPKQGVYNFTELDYQLKRANEVGADVIFGVGRRLPRWPECHVPDWAAKQPWSDQKKEIIEYITKVVNRYKDNPAITYWQVENEPFLTVFAKDHCGNLDVAFLKQEIALVHQLDPSRPILVTDSGNLGTWAGAYRNGDAFGTSVYVYLWNPQLGPFRTVMPPWAYWIKKGVMQMLYGKKEVMLIELSAEPWLLAPVENVDLKTQLSRMNLDKFKEILSYAKETRMSKQYLWGAEWWYWLRQHGHPEMWEYGKTLFNAADQSTSTASQ